MMKAMFSQTATAICLLSADFITHYSLNITHSSLHITHYALHINKYMNYILADKDKAVAVGFSDSIHALSVDGKMILTEKEVVTSPLLQGDIDERMAALDGKLVGGGVSRK